MLEKSFLGGHVLASYSHVGWNELARGDIVDNLVTGEEKKSVWVVLESLNDSEGSVEVCGGVSGPRLSSVDGLSDQRRVDIKQHVDADIIEDAGAFIVVEVRIDIVHTDGIDT